MQLLGRLGSFFRSAISLWEAAFWSRDARRVAFHLSEFTCKLLTGFCKFNKTGSCVLSLFRLPCEIAETAGSNSPDPGVVNAVLPRPAPLRDDKLTENLFFVKVFLRSNRDLPSCSWKARLC